MADWRIYYDDDSTFDSTMGAPVDAPAFGVICIVNPHPDHGRVIMNGWDWYYYHSEEEGWWGADIHGLVDHLLHNLPFQALKQGRNAPDKDWQRILAKAIADPDFPVKSSRSVRERPRQVT